MLCYISHGPRPFGSIPFAPIRRPNWEFFAVVKGEIAPVIALSDQPIFTGATFWLFPPGHLHGWKGKPRKRCSIAVFQYDRIPQALELLAQRLGGIALTLKPAEKFRFEALARELLPYAWSDSALKEVLAERVLLDLTLLILQATRADAGQTPKYNEAVVRVQAAEKRFRVELRSNPPLALLAFAAGVSVAHLRRLFWQVRGRSPSAVTHDIRMDAASRLLTDRNQKLETIALECGFGSVSNFCQAFKKMTGLTPGAFRQRPSCLN